MLHLVSFNEFFECIFKNAITIPAMNIFCFILKKNGMIGKGATYAVYHRV